MVAKEELVLFISSFGGISVAVSESFNRDEAVVKFSDMKRYSSKVWALIEYLIFSGKEAIAFEELIELLWAEDEDVDNPLSALRILVHRTRAMLDTVIPGLGAKLILLGNNAYIWNKSADNIWVDTMEFEKLHAEAQKADALRKIELLLSATGLYAGHFLQNRSSSQWVIVLDMYYHSKYLAICEELITLLESFGRTLEIIQLCKQALILEPFAEPLHIGLMKALINSNSQSLAIEHFNNLTTKLMNDLGVAPSEQLLEIYKYITRGRNLFETNIDAICEAMYETEEDETEGAYFIEYEPFKQVFQIKSRECVRTGQALQLALISVVPARGRKHNQRAQEVYVEKLRSVTQKCLRPGDIITIFSATQILVLLQSINYENSDSVLDRINQKMQETSPRSGYLLQGTHRVLEPSSLHQNRGIFFSRS